MATCGTTGRMLGFVSAARPKTLRWFEEAKMAIDMGEVAGTHKQTIARVELYTDAVLARDDFRIVAYFEDGVYDDNDALQGSTRFGTAQVVRRLGDIKTQRITAAGVTVTCDQLADLIKAAIYQFRQEDIDNEEKTQP